MRVSVWVRRTDGEIERTPIRWNNNLRQIISVIIITPREPGPRYLKMFILDFQIDCENSFCWLISIVTGRIITRTDSTFQSARAADVRGTSRDEIVRDKIANVKRRRFNTLEIRCPAIIASTINVVVYYFFFFFCVRGAKIQYENQTS